MSTDESRPPSTEPGSPEPIDQDPNGPESVPTDPTPPVDPDGQSESDDFATLLESSGPPPNVELKPGDQVEGVFVLMGDTECFVDCGGRQELPIATTELYGEDGNLRWQQGDRFKAHVQKSGAELRLTLALDPSSGGLQTLEQAFSNQVPVEGKVSETNKGGFTVDLAGFRAFCPYSQIDTHRVQDPESFVGRSLKFRILEISEDGRNIVLSRRVLLNAEREEIASVTRDKLGLGDVIEGKVTRLVPFGAFVDIGGLEGLVHISQISHQRIQEAASVLQESQTVKVKVLEILNLGEGRQERISLSIKALTADPWPDTAGQLEIGSETSGRITRLTDYGAFVELQPGVEGLIHISELSSRRIQHPREIITEGEEVPIRILDVDLDRRRISLSLKQSSHWEGD